MMMMMMRIIKYAGVWRAICDVYLGRFEFTQWLGRRETSGVDVTSALIG